MSLFSDKKFPQSSIAPNDTKARWVIWIVSIIIFIGIAFLSRVKLDLDLGFDPHDFARANALINSFVTLFLISALVAVKNKNYRVHKRLMMLAIIFSILFLISYVCHHLTTGETKYGDIDGDGMLSSAETGAVGASRYFYYFILLTHIPLAGIILPFILFTAYRGLSGSYEKHKKLARITWPIWLYVAATGVIIYWMISPYY